VSLKRFASASFGGLETIFPFGTSWTELRDNIDDITIEDPANPTGNDLSELFNSSIKLELSTRARTTLDLIERYGWEQVFGQVPEKSTKASIVTGYTARSAASFGE
jgi:hypothetical protein